MIILLFLRWGFLQFSSASLFCARERVFFFLGKRKERHIERDLLIIQKTEIYTIFTINNWIPKKKKKKNSLYSSRIQSTRVYLEDLVGFWQNGVGSGRILAVVVVVVGLGFGLPVLLFDELGLVEGIVGELPDVRNVVVLSYVYSRHRPYYERKATLYDTHLPKIKKQNLGLFDFD